MKALTPAERILISLGITHPAEIDLEAIAWSQGAIVNYRPLDKCEAMIVGSERHAIITVNRDSLAVRKRFSLAHEIGHWHHHRGRTLFCDAKEIESPTDDQLNPERQADEFASDLILPGYLFQSYVTKLQKVTLAAVREIGEEFKASLTAICIRIVRTNIFPILIVCHRMEGRHWFKRADMVPGWWFPRLDLDPDSLAFDMLFGSASESSFPRKVGAEAWFSFRNAERFEIQEQSFRLPNRELLTVLTIPDEGLG